MKIKRIVLYNIGPYIDRNVFDLSIENKEKNIVLIGGKNGAGKTTFFKSIKTCLYGCKVWGFDAPGKEYCNIIESLVNAKMQYDTAAKAYVEIEIVFDDGKEVNSYVLHREWVKSKRTFEESFSIHKNEILLDSEEEADFTNYLLSIIPPDMFNFYFFDGEAITDFFLGNNGGKNFKNAFLKLYGLDTLTLMVENFERYFKKRDGGKNVFEDYQEHKRKIEQLDKNLDELQKEKQDIESKIDLLQIRLQSMQNEFTQSGGISISEWKSITAELSKEEARRDEINRWLKESANNFIPFVILEKQLSELLTTIQSEQSAKKGRIIADTLNSQEFVSKFCRYCDKKGYDDKEMGDILSFICAETSGDADQKTLFDMSDAQMSKIIAQIYEKKDFDPGSIDKAIKNLVASLRKTKTLREKLSASSIDGFDDYSKGKESTEKEILSLTLSLEKVKQNIILAEADLSAEKTAFTKAKEAYEKLLKSKSISEMSTRAIGAYTLLEEKLIRRQSKILQEEFIRCFAAIINKDNFVDGIVIDKNINVIPYKFIDVSFLQIDNYLRMDEQLHFLDLFDYSYYSQINDLRLGNVQSVKLPAPINAPFSQGERQVYIMSIYLALLKTSRKDIPFFIDTPFARIDSNHRGKIVKEFFKTVSNQMFILSTDEEIVGQYESLIDENVSNRFLLEINNYGKTAIIPDRYFEVIV